MLTCHIISTRHTVTAHSNARARSLTQTRSTNTNFPSLSTQTHTPHFLTSLVKCTTGRSHRLCLMQTCEHKAEWSENSLYVRRYDSKQSQEKHTHKYMHATLSLAAGSLSFCPFCHLAHTHIYGRSPQQQRFEKVFGLSG